MKEISKTDARNFAKAAASDFFMIISVLMFSSPIDSNHVFPSLNQPSQDVHKSFSRAGKKSMLQPQYLYMYRSAFGGPNAHEFQWGQAYQHVQGFDEDYENLVGMHRCAGPST